MVDCFTPMGYGYVMKQILQTVVESLEFSSQAKKCLEHSTKIEFINYIAANPTNGSLIQGTGGARKIRWGSDKHKGKSGGVRIIYYYHNHNMPIFLFTVYPKNKKDNLTNAECNELKLIIKELIKIYNK
jgi:mRNA-degrading endonuclease RelE of RelBE toxin-antitoxin system